ncbi:MAG: M14 family zinc carboxypeptidase [Candidatus Sumerlaeaceae bacterium]
MLSLTPTRCSRHAGSTHLALLLFALLLAGCQQKELISRVRAQQVKAGFFPEATVIGKSVMGRNIEMLTLGKGPDYVLILASIHGNEAAGTPLVLRLEKLLRREPALLEGRRVALIPVFNPDGFIGNTRTNARGVDLNRNYPAENRENTPRYGLKGLSEPESQAFMAVLEKERPARIVMIHQPLSKVDWDGPAQDLSKRMAEYCELPSQRIGARPGSLGSMFGVDWKLPIITYELPKRATGMDEGILWRRFGGPLLASVTWPDPPPAKLIEEIYQTPAVNPWAVAAPWMAGAVGVAALVAMVAWLLRRRKQKPAPVVPAESAEMLRSETG